MNKIFHLITLLFGIALTREISFAQQFLVYRYDSLERPFVVSRYYTDPISGLEVSEVIESKTFSTKAIGAATEVTLSNAVIFVAHIPQNSATDPATKVNQYVATAAKLVLHLDSNEKIVQSGSFLKVDGAENKQGSVPEKYEGTNAVQYLKDHSLWPPPEPKN